MLLLLVVVVRVCLCRVLLMHKRGKCSYDCSSRPLQCHQKKVLLFFFFVFLGSLGCSAGTIVEPHTRCLYTYTKKVVRLGNSVSTSRYCKFDSCDNGTVGSCYYQIRSWPGRRPSLRRISNTLFLSCALISYECSERPTYSLTTTVSYYKNEHRQVTYGDRVKNACQFT